MISATNNCTTAYWLSVPYTDGSNSWPSRRKTQKAMTLPRMVKCLLRMVSARCANDRGTYKSGLPLLVTNCPKRQKSWAKLSQACEIFNAPYHICASMFSDQLVQILRDHDRTCLDKNFYCGLAESATTHPQLAIVCALNTHFTVALKLMVRPRRSECCKDMISGDIVSIYKNFTAGPRFTGRRITNEAHVFDYAVVFEGLVRDVWDHVAGRPCHHLGFTNDALDMARDNMTIFILCLLKTHFLACKALAYTEALLVPQHLPTCDANTSCPQEMI